MRIRTAIVTGGTSGIGRGIVSALRAKGVKTYALSRRAESGECEIACDVTDESGVRAAVGAVLSAEGRIDLLVNCAGFGISGAVEFTSPEDAHRQLEVNLYGTERMIRAVLPAMRAQRGGRIVNVSSVAAVAPIPFQAWYSVSKAAINALTLAVDNEVRPFGIQVCAVMPGDIATGFTDARGKSEAGDDVYGGRIARSVAKMERDERGGMDAMAAGAAIVRTALRRNPKPLSSLGPGYRAICVLIKLLPVRTVRWLLGLLYG